MYGLRVVLADTDLVSRKKIKDQLLGIGFSIIGETGDGRNLLQMVFNIQPDLVILCVQLAGKDGLEVAKAIDEHRMAPVILISEMSGQNRLSEALKYWTFSYMLKPIDEVNLIPTIEVCMATYRKICHLEQENRKLKQNLETRKVVEKAKGLLIQFKGMTEQQAFRHMQKVSMDKCIPIQKVAQQIINNLDEKKIQQR
jgi:response regulator NasT